MTAPWDCADFLRVLFYQYLPRKELDWKEAFFVHSTETYHLCVYRREKAEEVRVKYCHISSQKLKESSIKIFITLFLSLVLGCEFPDAV